MGQLEGLGKIDRERLATLMRGTKGTISVGEASTILRVSPSDSAKMLARWTKKGWLSRVRRGLYVPVPLESRTPDVPLEDPWVIAVRLFSPCYIGGWSAAEHWDLTEQIFRTIIVMTTQKPRDRRPTIRGTSFLLSTVLDKSLFGFKTVWRGKSKFKFLIPPAQSLTCCTILDGVAGFDQSRICLPPISNQRTRTSPYYLTMPSYLVTARFLSASVFSWKDMPQMSRSSSMRVGNN